MKKIFEHSTTDNNFEQRPKTNLRGCVSQVNYNILKTNFISNSVFRILLFLQTVFLIVRPIVAITQKQFLINLEDEYSIVNKPQLFSQTVYFMTTYHCLIFLLYGVLILLQKHKKPCDTNEEKLESNSAIFSLIQRMLLFLLILKETAFHFPAQYFLNRCITQSTVSEVSPSLRPIAILAGINIPISVTISLFFTLFITIPFQFEGIPWAKPLNKSALLYTLWKYTQAVAISIPLTWNYANIARGISLTISLIVLSVNFWEVYAFDKLIQLIVRIQNCVAIVSSIFMIALSNGKTQQKAGVFIFAYALISISFSLTIKLWIRWSTLNKFKEFCQNSLKKEDLDIFYHLLQHLNIAQSQNLLKSKDQILQLMDLGVTHKIKCYDIDCLCKSSKFITLFASNDIIFNLRNQNSSYSQQKEMHTTKMKMLILFMKIILVQLSESPSTPSYSEGQIHQELNLLIIYYQYQLKKKTYNTYFKLIQNDPQFVNKNKKHCFNHFYFRNRVVDDWLQIGANCNIRTQKSEQYIFYEINLKHFIQNIEKLSLTMTNYWESIQKKEMNLKKQLLIGYKFLNSFKQFDQSYQQIKAKCGKLYQIEIIVWKLYKNVLNFELEADEQLDAISTLLNKKRVHKKLQSEDESDEIEDIDNQNSLIAISLYPSSFEQVLLVNKQFELLSKFPAEELLGNNLDALLPLGFGNVHKKILKNYIKRSTLKAQINNSNFLYLRNKQGFMVPIAVKVSTTFSPKYDFTVVALIKKNNNIQLGEQYYHSDDVFTIFTNKHMHIKHFTQNCKKKLLFSDAFISQSVSILDLFPDLSQTFQDYKDCDQFNDNTQMVFSKIIDLPKDEEFIVSKSYKRLKKVIKFGQHKLPMTLFFFSHQYYGKTFNQACLVIRQEEQFDQRNSMVRSVITPQIFLQLQSEKYQLRKRLNNDNQSVSEKEQELTYNTEQENKVLQSFYMTFNEMGASQQSQSSTKSSNITYKQVTDIKQHIDFQHKTNGIKMFRMLMLIVFLIIGISSTSLMIINTYSKNKFQELLEMKTTRNEIGNHLSKSRLSLLMLMMFSNQDQQFWENYEINIPLNNQSDRQDFFSNTLFEVTLEMQKELIEFQDQQDLFQDEVFQIIKEQKFDLDILSMNGNFYSKQANLISSLHEYLTKIDIFTHNEYNFQLGIDIFKSISENNYSVAIQSLDSDSAQTFQRFIFCLLNGKNQIQTSLREIDNIFAEDLQIETKTTVTWILITTVVSSALVFFSSLLIIPQLFKIIKVQQQTLDFTVYMTDGMIQSNFKDIELFRSYINENQFLKQNFNLYDDLWAQNSDANEQSIPSIPSMAGQEEDEESENEQSDQRFIKNKNTPQRVNKKKDNNKGNSELKKAFQKQNSLSNSEEMAQNLQNNEMQIAQIQVKEQSESLKLSEKMRKDIIIEKIKSIGIVFAFSLVFCIFFFTFYSQSNIIFNHFRSGFQEIEVFFKRVRCISDQVFYTQNIFLFNKTYEVNSDEYLQLQQIYNNCLCNEELYNDIKYNPDSVVQGLYDEIQKLDGPNFCEWSASIGFQDEDCSSDSYGGFLSIPSTDMIGIILQQIQQVQVKYQEIPYAQRTSEKLRELFFDKGVMDYYFLFAKYLFKVFAYLSEVSHDDFIDQIEKDFLSIKVVFGLIIGIILLELTLVMIWGISQLQHKLLVIRLMLKVIPSANIISLKNYLGEINTNLF